MRPDDITLVRSSFAAIVPIHDTVAALFYGRLFKVNPHLRALFPPDMTEQGRKLISMLDLAVTGLDALDTIMPIMRKLGRRHVAYGVQTEHYEVVCDALLWALTHALGDQFTEDHATAWRALYSLLSEEMLAGTADA